jgi:hypothetical protein
MRTVARLRNEREDSCAIRSYKYVSPTGFNGRLNRINSMFDCRPGFAILNPQSSIFVFCNHAILNPRFSQSHHSRRRILRA